MKKQLFIVLVISLLPHLSRAGSIKEFRMKVDSLKACLAHYDSLSPFEDTDAIEQVREEVINRLLGVLSDRGGDKFNIPGMLKSNALSVSCSPDNRICFFSLDEKTGGSFRSNQVILHYRPLDGEPRAELLDNSISETIPVASYETFALDSIARTYLATGTVITCNTCISAVAFTLTLDSTSYSIELLQEINCRSGDLEAFDYDPVKKIFSYEYRVSEDDPSYSQGTGSPGEYLRYKGKYHYRDGVFRSMESCRFTE